ncbi:hypothetical protein [Aestuariivivens sediminicola]|uniref:hypothetical protein n=1 Tax=Aestuariivivens sediminicola TaxID=2913560 RepID=UPI001F58A677|nr:hypothetical protein [Aestuariivivens sediminicola]
MYGVFYIFSGLGKDKNTSEKEAYPKFVWIRHDISGIHRKGLGMELPDITN